MEAELVGVSDYLPYHIWLVIYFDYQGCKVKNRVLHQDIKTQLRWRKIEGILALESEDII